MAYNMNYLSQFSPEERLKLSELLAMQQDNSEPGVQYDTGNQQFLSALADPKNYIRTSGFDENFMARSKAPAPLPQNFIRNERTGAVTDLGQSQPSQPALDYTMPIEMAGIGKGYRLKGDATRAVMADGRIVDMGRDTGEERKRRLADAEIAKREAEVRNLNAPSMSAEDKAYQEARGRNRAEAEASRMPGTKEYLAGQEEITRKNKLNSIIQENADTALESIKRAEPKIGYFSTGLPGWLLSNIGGTDAKDLEEALRPIKALTGFDKLQELREMSKTGGALGQVAVEELRFLQSVKGSLDTAQSESQFRDVLNSVKKYYERKRSGNASAPRAPVSGAESQAMLMQEAQAAIAAGAPREAVMQRLQERLGR